MFGMWIRAIPRKTHRRIALLPQLRSIHEREKVMDTIIAFAIGSILGGSFGVVVTAVLMADREDRK